MTYRCFKIPFGDHTLVGDLLSNDAEARTLVLHGAGEHGRLRTRFIREWFFRHGISSCAFDFIGHGETGGDVKQTSLYERTRQACAVIDRQNIRTPLRIVAASMGAYTAVKLVEHYPVETMVLLVPAMYAESAYRYAFGGGFTEIIRKPGSWRSSDAWRILSAYTGRLFLVSAEKDPVIPDGVIRTICASARNAEELVHNTVADAPHFVLTYLRRENPLALEALMKRIVGMLKI
jgi:pimeloyl-ACP methyl ester carboxylesterase